MATLYTSLLTMDNVTQEMESAFPGYDPTDSNTIATVEAIIDEISATIEGLLNRNLICKKHDRYINSSEWDYDSARAKYILRAEYPLVEIDTSGFTIGRDRFSMEDDLIIYSSAYSGLITYYSGYKRSEQDLSTFTDAGLTDLGTEPGNLPADVRGVALNGVLHAMAERNQGPGQRTRTVNAAVQTMSVVEPVRDYLMRIVKERIPHRMVIT